MKRTIARSAIFLVILLIGIFSQPADAKQDWILDILNNPSRYWNTTVTIVGDILAVNPNPAGTTRGTYTVMDDSCPRNLAVQTRDLPQVGRQLRITGIVITDPNNANVPMIKELERSSPSFFSNKTYLLIAVVAALLILVIVFVILATRPKKAVETVRPPQRQTTYSQPIEATRLHTPSPTADKTSLYSSNVPNAKVIIEKGDDAGKEYSITNPITTIGRRGMRKNDVELTDDTVSKTQASIMYDPVADQFSIKNESTSNPTMINDQAITGLTPLKSNDTVKMGKTVFRFRRA